MANIRFISFAGQIIETTVTDNPSVADAWVRNIRSTSNERKIIVGLDCEWRPNTSSTMVNRTAILQLCFGTKCLILQLLYMDTIPQSMKAFLQDSNATFVGVEVARDVAKLRNEYGLHCTNIADVREITLSRWPNLFNSPPGLKDLAYGVEGLVMPKPEDVCKSDWESRVLDDKQIEYAAIDAYASFRLGQRLVK